MGTKWLLALLLSVVVAVCCSCTSPETAGGTGDGNSPPLTPAPETASAQKATSTTTGDAGLYNRYNVHFYASPNQVQMTRGGPRRRDANIGSCTNYTDCAGHSFVPYNTRFRAHFMRRGLMLTVAETGMQIEFAFNRGEMGGMSVRDYLKLIMSPTPVDYSDLTPKDLDGIKAGKAMMGMTKQGVMVALGYPAKCWTPSTDLNLWVYRKDRANTVTVNFSPDGLVQSIN
jgi:hypothetical protein